MVVSISTPVFAILLLSSSMTLSVHGAEIRFFKDANFKGDKLDFNSSSSCVNLPSEFLSFHGSLKTSSCIALYSKQDCSDVTDFYNGIRGYVHVVKSEEDKFRQLNFTYSGQPRHQFQIKSLRDCTEMEIRPQADFDYYTEKNFEGQEIRFRDICSCASIPSKSYASVPRSANTYGNCFQIYASEVGGCSGKPFDTLFAMKFTIFYFGIYFIKPCYLPEPCKRYKTTILNLEPTHNILTIPVQIVQVQNASQQIINKNSTAQELSYEVETEISEAVQIEVVSNLKSEIPLNFSQIHSSILQTAAPVLENSKSTFKEAIGTALQNLQLNQNHSQTGNAYTTTKFSINGKSSFPPCTSNEVTAFVEVIEIEIPYRVLFKADGTIRNSEERISLEDVQKSFENFGNVNVSANGTAVAETILNIKLRFGIKSWTTITPAPVTECRLGSIELRATVINLTPGSVDPNSQQQAITTKQIIKNNGTTQQEDNYEAAKRINETAKFKFPKELTKMRSVSFLPPLQLGIEMSNPFISSAWAELQNGLSLAFQDRLNFEEAVTFEVQKEIEYRVQRKINVAPCTKYEVSSFLEIAENFEIPYQVQFEITGSLGDEAVGVEEIQTMLEDITILRNKDNFTVVAQSTAKLILTYGVGSGIDATGSPIPDCRGRFIKFGASIVKLDLVGDESNSTLPAQRFHVAPKLSFINNSTTHQEKSFVAAKDIQETAVFEFPKDITPLDFIRMEDMVKSKLQNVIPFLPNVWAKLKGGFVPNRSNWNETVSFEVQNEKEILVQEQLNLAPCMKYDVSAFIEMANDVEISYRVLLEVTGKLGLEAVTAEEIRVNLKDMTLLHDKDDFTVVAETTMKLSLDYVLGTAVDNAGTHMLDCMEIQAALVANCKFTCSR